MAVLTVYVKVAAIPVPNTIANAVNKNFTKFFILLKTDLSERWCLQSYLLNILTPTFFNYIEISVAQT